MEETIRMANIAAFIFRTATKDVEYKGMQFINFDSNIKNKYFLQFEVVVVLHAGYTIPKGWKVMMWVRYLHTNPENFDDPMSFNPDRWNVRLSHTLNQTYLY